MVADPFLERFMNPEFVGKETPEATPVEVDPRFPSGKWIGFYLQKPLSGRQPTELILQFSLGIVVGEGQDAVGDFLIRGRYDLENGKCHWVKRYLGQHDVDYEGDGEGKGIWGVWTIQTWGRGGFHIWPEGMADPTQHRLAEVIEQPITCEDVQDLVETLANS